MRPSPVVEAYLLSVVYGDRRGPAAASVRAVLRALSAAYRLGIRLYLLPFKLGLRREKRLGCPVISVGNLTVGGTGKTPTVRYLCEGLTARGWKPAVLSYGYAGSLSGRFGVVSDGTGLKLGVELAGDEPVMLAGQLPGVPVLVGKDRVRTGRCAIERLGADVLVLDDGFQVWKVHRDVDIVLVNDEDPFDNGRTLPAGKLREPVDALGRADCILFAGDCSDEKLRAALTSRIRMIAPRASIFHTVCMPASLSACPGDSRLELEGISGKRAFALSSIANPAAFERTVEQAGATVVGSERFPDHHLYSAEDIEEVEGRALASRAEFIIATEKDAVKLAGRHAALPILALGIRLLPDDEEGFWKTITGKLGAPGGLGRR